MINVLTHFANFFATAQPEGPRRLYRVETAPLRETEVARGKRGRRSGPS